MFRHKQREREGVVRSYLGGLLAGLLISAPIAAWLSPRSGAATREQIVQRGVILRRKASDTVRKPIEQVQEKIEDLRGESVEESLAEGRSLAAQRAPITTLPQ